MLTVTFFFSSAEVQFVAHSLSTLMCIYYAFPSALKRLMVPDFRFFPKLEMFNFMKLANCFRLFFG